MCRRHDSPHVCSRRVRTRAGRFVRQQSKFRDRPPTTGGRALPPVRRARVPLVAPGDDHVQRLARAGRREIHLHRIDPYCDAAWLGVHRRGVHRPAARLVPTCRRPTTPRTRASRAASASPSSGTSKEERIVNNELADIVRILDLGFGHGEAAPARGCYGEDPAALLAASTPTCRTRVDESGFAGSQEAYEEAAVRVFVSFSRVAGGAARHAALPRRRLHHRRPTGASSRCSCASTACTWRPLPLQPQAARRPSEPLGLRAGAVPAARHRRLPSRWSRSSATTTRRTTRSSRAGSPDGPELDWDAPHRRA